MSNNVKKLKKSTAKTATAKKVVKKVPMNVTFKARVKDDTIPGANPYRWQDVTSRELFENKRVVLFALPGAFTPTCSNYQLPTYEKLHGKFMEHVDEIYCLSVNDAFVMNQWAKTQKVSKVKMIPDGSGAFTDKMGMLVKKDNLGFGERSWRYAAVVNNGMVEKLFTEPGLKHNLDSDPYGESSPDTVMDWLKSNPRK